MGRTIKIIAFDHEDGYYYRDAPDPTDATNFVFVRESPNIELQKRWEVIFFVPSAPEQERECLIGAFETKESAEQEAKEFTVVLQKIIDAIKAPERW